MIGDVLLGTLRLAHALAAAAWVGGALAYTVGASPGAPSSVGRLRELLRLSIGIFVVTGVIMALERLSTAPLPPVYLALLGVKITIGLWMFWLARRVGTATDASRRLTPERAILGWGVVIYALAMALRFVYEGTVREMGPLGLSVLMATRWA